jgi:serine/threonine protein kinase
MVVSANRKDLPALKKYEILDKIADGSMAAVYKGRHREDGTLVAIKVPNKAVEQNATLRGRFQQEFRVGKSLSHPNIVRTLDFGKEGATFYLVMEFIDGSDLWQRIEQLGPLPEKAAVDIIVQVARGLHAAHKHGIIHRDVKPGNILLDTNGTAKLGDLGLIKDLEMQAGLTCTGKGLGTPNFSAPEQFSDARHVDARCDVYGLAATLFMALTGELPFSGRSLAAILRLKLKNELRPPRQLVPSLSEKVNWAIRRALQADPGRRHASCQEFIQALTGEGGAPGAALGDIPPGGSRTKKPPSGNERRRAVRYNCNLPTFCQVMTSIHDGETTIEERWPVTVRDLSVAGIKFVLNRRFEPRTVVAVELASPDWSFQLSADMKVARVTRVRDGHWLIGGSFAEPISKEDLRKLL